MTRPWLAFAFCLALLLFGFAGCAALPDPRPASRIDPADIAYTHRINAIWYEVRDGRVDHVCRRVLPYDTSQVNEFGGCHYWDGRTSHAFTPIVRDDAGLCTLGHEIAHDPNAIGDFHGRGGRWLLDR